LSALAFILNLHRCKHIQCKFFYNIENEENGGVCKCENKCTLNKKNKKINKCKIISFMVFRTGSILSVGNCYEDIIYLYKQFK